MRIFFLNYVAFFVIVDADAADRSGEEHLLMIDGVLCISRRTCSPLTLVLSPAGTFCVVLPVFHDFSLSNLLVATIWHLAVRNYSRFGPSLSSVSLGTQDGMSTRTRQGARRLPAVHTDVVTVTLCKPVLGYVSFDLYNYVTECCQFEDFWSFFIPC
jgi:hypothetical protein